MDKLFASNAILVILFLLIKAAIADYDVLYSGNPEKNKYAKAFQENLPTKYIMAEYNVNMNEAKNLWYNIFNKWRNKNHDMHYNWETSLRRGFKCRMVHFIIISFRFMFFLSIISIVIISIVNGFEFNFGMDPIDKYFKTHKDIVVPVFFTIFCFAIYLVFLVINYPGGDIPKGCFLRFSEINQLNIDWLRENIASREEFINYGTENNNNT